MSLLARLRETGCCGGDLEAARLRRPIHERALRAEWLEPRTLLNGEGLAGADGAKPVANPDYFWTPADTALNVSAPGLLDNDYDPEGQRLEAVNLVGNLPLDHGMLYLDAWRNDGSFDYVPYSGHAGRDTFTYYCVDPDGWWVETTVTIDVGIFNRAPFLVEPIDDVTVDQGAASTVIDLAPVFDDLDIPRGDEITYTVNVSPPILPIVDEVSEASYTSIHQDLLYTHLGDDRGYDSVQHDLARDNIYNYFEDLGFTASLDVIPEIVDVFNNTYDFDPPLVNVVGVKPGAVHPEDVYLVGAHYDSVHNPGADDNASGTAAVMEIARVLSTHTFESTVVFVAFDGEEDGLFGSMHYAEHHYSDHNAPGFNSELLGFVNLDMIAYNQPGEDHDVVSLYDSDDVGNVKPGLVNAFADYGGGLIGRDDGVMGMSDHEYFEIYGFDAALVIESGVHTNPHYHEPTDAVETPDYIDYTYATNVTRAVTGYIAQVAKPIGTVDALTGSIADDQLTLNYAPGESGGAVITVRATDSEGLFAEDSFSVTINASNSDVYLQGTNDDDTISVWAGLAGTSLHRVDINGAVTTYSPADHAAIHIDGLGGNDRITITGTAGDDEATLRPNSVDVLGSGYAIYGVNVETIVVDGGVGTDDEATLTGSDNSNRLYSYAEYSRLFDSPRTFSHRVDGFEVLTINSAGGGRDYAYLYDSPGKDELNATPESVQLVRPNGSSIRTVTGFERVYAYASNGGNDSASLTGSATTRNRLYGYADYSILTESRRSFYFYARGFDTVAANSPGSGYTYAYLHDSSGNDTLEATPRYATMNRPDTWPDTTATGFLRVYAYSTRGGNDTATLTGSATGGNYYRGYPTYSTMTDLGQSFYYYARGFNSVTATGSQSDTSTDRAYLYDSSGDDTFTAAFQENGKHQGACLTDTAGSYENLVKYFDLVYARSSDRDTEDTIAVTDEEQLAYRLIRSGTW